MVVGSLKRLKGKMKLNKLNTRSEIFWPFFVFILLTIKSHGSEIHWASEVISFSSQKGTKEYSAMQVLGKPELFPQGGKVGCSWTPSQENSTSEFIHVSFDTSIYIQRIIIAESFNPGSVSRIYLIDEEGNEFKVLDRAAEKEQNGSKVFIHDIPKTSYKVKSVKVFFQTFAVSGRIFIDAIGISEEKIDLKAEDLIYSEKFSTIELENLGENINSNYNELLPRISDDGKRLYFARTNHPENTPPITNADIWYSDLDDNGEWSEAKRFDNYLNDDHYNYVVSITPGGKELELGNIYNQTEIDKRGVSYSRFKNGSWTFPKKINIKNFQSLGKYSSYYFSNSGKTLLLDLETVKGIGGNDLYVSFLQENGDWSEPKNLGKDINTKCDDHLPFLASDERTLFFVSFGHPGYGSGDIFMSRRLDYSWTSWTKPINLGPVINTPGWEGGITIPASGDYAYVVSNTNSIGGDDIFRFRIPEELQPEDVVRIKGKVLDQFDSSSIEARIIIEDIFTGKYLAECMSDAETGDFEIVLPFGNKYSIRSISKNYLGISQRIDLREDLDQDLVELNIPMIKKQQGNVVLLNNIFFDKGKYELKQGSKIELDNLFQILNNNSSMVIEIEGHTDNTGNNKDNLDLSRMRSKAVYDYLISKGIDPVRLSYVGYGEERPKFSNKDAAGRSMNRRVEFRIKEK